MFILQSLLHVFSPLSDGVRMREERRKEAAAAAGSSNNSVGTSKAILSSRRSSTDSSEDGFNLNVRDLKVNEGCLRLTRSVVDALIRRGRIHLLDTVEVAYSPAHRTCGFTAVVFVRSDWLKRCHRVRSTRTSQMRFGLPRLFLFSRSSADPAS